MLVSSNPPLRIRKGIFHSFRFQISFVLIVGVIIPSLFAAGIPDPQILNSQTFLNSVIFVAFAAILLVCTIRRLGIFPSKDVAKYIFPTLSGIYALIFTVIVIFRIEYSSKVMALGFLATLFARYAIVTLNLRGPQRIHYIIPGGRSRVVMDLPELASTPLTVPEAPNLTYAAIIADLHHDHSPEWERFLAEAAISGTPVYHFKQVWEAVTGQVHIEHLSENSFGALIPSLAYRKLKRMADIGSAIVLLPLAAAIIVIAALLIKAEGAGPVFFRQRRMGYRGQVFDMYKLRTMSVTHNGDDRDLSKTLSDDERITRIGRFLRQTRIDELPQILNILRGEMSWIGPRPETVSLSKWYEDKIPFYRYRHIVRPGISGWAQVNQGHVHSVDEVGDKLKYDFYYIKNISHWLDILIAFRTVGVIFTGLGAK